MSRNYYTQVIKLLHKGNINYKDICGYIAENQPKTFIQAYEKTIMQNFSHLDLKLVELLRKGLKIQAIKEQRAATSMNWMEAKAYVDELERIWNITYK